MNKLDTIEAIKEAKMIHQSSLSEAQILLSLEIFFVKGRRAQAQEDLDILRLAG